MVVVVKVEQHFQEILIFASGSTPKQLALNFFQATVMYLNAINTTNSKNMTLLIDRLPSAEVKVGKSTLQQFIDIGEERGIERGMEIPVLNAFDKGNSPESISIFNDIPLLTVQQILRKYGRIV
jgi:hypothetical protein